LPERFVDVYVAQGVWGVLLSSAAIYWYICVLALIYLIVPLLKSDLSVLIGLVAMALLLGAVNMGAAKFVIYLFYFMLGSYIYNRMETFVSCSKYIVCGFMFFCLSTAWYFISDGATLMDVYTKLIIALPACLFFLASFWREERPKDNLLVNIGRNTLIIYLTHLWIIILIEKLNFAEIYSGFACWGLLIGLAVLYKLLITLFNRLPQIKIILLQPSKIFTVKNF